MDVKDIQTKLKYVNKTSPPGDIQLNSSYYYQVMQLDNDLVSKMNDYEKIDDEVVEVSSALDIYADNAVSGGNNLEKEFIVVLQKPNRNYQQVIDYIDNNTELRDLIWSFGRNVLKYGNWYIEIVTKDNKIVRFKELPVKEMRIIKDNYGRLLKIVQKSDTGETKSIDIWKCVHLSMNRPYTYGDSILKRLRRISRQLRLCEDAIVIARLTKATQKVIYKIDVTGMTSVEALAYIKKWKSSMGRKKMINPITGEIVEDFNPLRDEQDIYLPVRQNSPTDVTTLSGDANISDIKDIEFQQNRLFAGLKVPKAYLGFEADTHNRNVITALDIQFARNVRRLQKILEKGIRHIYDVAFILAGYSPDQINYKIVFPTISTIDSLTEWQVNQTKLMSAQLLLGMGISLPDEWVLGSLLGLPKSEVEAISAYTEKITKEQEAEAQQQQAMGGEGQLPPGQAAPVGQQAQQPQGLVTSPQTPPEGMGGESGGMTADDEEMMRNLFASDENGNKVYAELVEVLRSNRQIQHMLQETAELYEWKTNWLTTQQQIDYLNNKLKYRDQA